MRRKKAPAHPIDGAWLRKMRGHLNVSQAALAEELGVNVRTICKAECSPAAPIDRRTELAILYLLKRMAEELPV